MVQEAERGVAQILNDAARAAWFVGWLASRHEDDDAEAIAKLHAWIVDRMLDALYGLGIKVQGRPTLQELIDRMDDDPNQIRVIISVLRR